MRETRRFETLLAAMGGVLLTLAPALSAASRSSAPHCSASFDVPSFERIVPRMSCAEQQLAYARALKRAMQGREGSDARRRRERAVAAYRAIREYHPEAPAKGAEGAFRAGELLRAVGSTEDARGEFRVAIDLGARTPFRARGGLEMGHIHRREGRSDLALDSYLAVASDHDAEVAHRDDAWLWVGRVWRDLGRMREARSAWRSVALSGEDPIDRILAYDYLTLTWVDDDDLEAAAGVLDECMRAHAEIALEETYTGERVRKALTRMRGLEMLQRAIESRFRERQEQEREPPDR
jgi:tetratricopeptide (TPR) repeat protein